MEPIDESEVREVLGVKSTNRKDGVCLTEQVASIVFMVTDENGYARVAVITPDNARRLARQLHRLARRIEERNA